MPYMLVDGTNDWAEAPSLAAYNPTDRIDARVEVDLDDYSGTPTLISRRGTGGTNGSFQFFASGSNFAARIWNGTGANALYGGGALGATPGTPIQLRMVADASDAEVTFWNRATGSDLTVDTGWSQVGAAVTLSPATLYASSTDPIEIGATAQGQLEATGKFYRACLKIDGALVFDADFSDTSTWVFA